MTAVCSHRIREHQYRLPLLKRTTPIFKVTKIRLERGHRHSEVDLRQGQVSPLSVGRPQVH